MEVGMKQDSQTKRQPVPDMEPVLDHLQKQLTEAWTENKLLKRDLQRHTLALKLYQDQENDIKEITAKHKKETKALTELLDETFVVGDGLVTKLQATEKNLEATRNKLQQLLQEQPSLLEEEKLIDRLTKATEELQEKEWKIQDLEKTVDGFRSTLKRQLLIQKEKWKLEMSWKLQKEMDHLSRLIMEINKELEKFNIDYRIFDSQTPKKDKMVQRDGVNLMPQPPLQRLYPTCSAPERMECQQSAVTVFSDGQLEGSFPLENPAENIHPEDLFQEEIHPEDLFQEEINLEDPQEFVYRWIFP